MTKILLAAPTSIHKSYCQKEWFALAMGMGHELFIVDNSPGNANKSFYRQLGINYKWVNPKGKKTIEYITESQNMIRDYFLKGDYTHLAFLETDLFPNPNVFEYLSLRNAPVIGHPYFIHKGDHSAYMIQASDLQDKYLFTRNMGTVEAFSYINGKAMGAYAIGFGCVLIRRDVLELLKFRATESAQVINDKIHNSHADSFFYADCALKGVPVLVDTSVTIRHYNSSWEKVYEHDDGHGDESLKPAAAKAGRGNF